MAPCSQTSWIYVLCLVWETSSIAFIQPVAKIMDLCILMLHAIHTLVILLYLLSFYKNTWILAGNNTGICQHWNNGIKMMW
jgi:hypothetical protein